MSDIRPIDANALLERLEEWHKPDEREYSSQETYLFDIRNAMYNDIISDIRKERTLAYVPEVRAYWDVSILPDHFNRGYDSYMHKCSKCHSTTISDFKDIGWDYCPYCGARMDAV